MNKNCFHGQLSDCILCCNTIDTANKQMWFQKLKQAGKMREMSLARKLFCAEPTWQNKALQPHWRHRTIHAAGAPRSVFVGRVWQNVHVQDRELPECGIPKYRVAGSWPFWFVVLEALWNKSDTALAVNPYQSHQTARTPWRNVSRTSFPPRRSGKHSV